MQFWLVQTLNSLALGGLLFLLSSGFSLIFGLQRTPNLAHGALFMLGVHFGATLLSHSVDFWLAAPLAGLAVGPLGAALERLVLRNLAGNEEGRVRVTLGVSFIIADLCLLVWTGDPIPVPAPPFFRQPVILFGLAFPSYRLVVLGVAVAAAVALFLLMERTAALLSAARLQELPGLAHVPQLQDTARFHAAVRDFVAG